MQFSELNFLKVPIHVFFFLELYRYLTLDIDCMICMAVRKCYKTVLLV